MSRSATLASNMLAAMRRTWFFTSRVAIFAAPAPRVAERDPPVDIVLNGVLSLDPHSMRTSWSGTPISSATTCAIVVSWPCPWLTCHVWITMSPVGSMRAQAVSPGRSKPSDLANSGGPGAISMNVAEPEPEVAALGQRGSLAFTEGRHIEFLDGLVETFPHGHTDHRHSVEHDHRLVGRGHKIAAADLDRVNADHLGDLVEEPLTHHGLDCPWRPIGNIGRLIGHHHASLKLVGLDPHGIGQQRSHDAGEHRRRERQHRIGPDVDGHALPEVPARGRRHRLRRQL